MRFAIVGGFSGLFIGLPLLIMLLSICRDARASTRVIASLDSLRVEQRGILFKRTKQMPSDEIEELTVPPETVIPGEIDKLPMVLRKVVMAVARHKTKPIVARSDKTTIEFGKHLTREEKDWVHAIVKRMLTA